MQVSYFHCRPSLSIKILTLMKQLPWTKVTCGISFPIYMQLWLTQNLLSWSYQAMNNVIACNWFSPEFVVTSQHQQKHCMTFSAYQEDNSLCMSKDVYDSCLVLNIWTKKSFSVIFPLPELYCCSSFCFSLKFLYSL